MRQRINVRWSVYLTDDKEGFLRKCVQKRWRVRGDDDLGIKNVH